MSSSISLVPSRAVKMEPLAGYRGKTLPRTRIKLSITKPRHSILKVKVLRIIVRGAEARINYGTVKISQKLKGKPFKSIKPKQSEIIHGTVVNTMVKPSGFMKII